jgi:esterase/lipase
MNKDYWIHGNGLSQAILPSDVLGHDLPGHGHCSWDQSKYTMPYLIDYFCDLVPIGSHIIGHSLGGHIALNVAVKRSDLTVTNIGMIPAQTMQEVMEVFKPTSEFQQFCDPNREYQDLVNLAKLYTHNLAHQSLFIDAMMKQDPMFPSTLFTQGFTDYDWNEVEKVKMLGERFTLVVNDQDPLINEQAALNLPINKVYQSLYGHCPWQPQSLYQYARSNEMPTTLGTPL